MKHMNLKSASFVAAIAIAAGTTLAAQAQGPQAGAPGAAAASQTPANVNVVNVPTVTIGNTDLQPVPVKEATREPVHANFSITLTPGKGASTLGTFAVPAGKRLVVEHFSAGCRSDSENFVNALLVNEGANLTFLALTSVPFLAFPGDVLSTGALPVSAYIDQGALGVQITRASGIGSTICTLTVLGYLTPLS